MEKTTAARSPRAWAIHPNRAGFVADLWRGAVAPLYLDRADPTGDLWKYATKADLYQQLLSYYGQKRSNTAMNSAIQFWSFAHEIGVGDLVVIPEDSDGDLLAVGRVQERYQYHPGNPPSLRHRLSIAWDRIGIDRSAVRPDLRAGLGSLVSVRELVDNNAADRIAHLAKHGTDPGPEEPSTRAELARTLGEAMAAAALDPPKPLEMPVRELLAHWGYQQRSDTAITDVKRDLLQSGLTTVPPFTEGNLERVVKLVGIPVSKPAGEGEDESGDESPITDGTENLVETDSIALRIGNFPFPTKPITT
ncbi:hypothetical protein [Glycomyces harbinensis]|uniref:hypothetical protein n=1 Tax=Glycomyces harbinensis TaxID=58114 RepID=UPI00115F88A4|nr:hypothetical protein [Glycomyces harbinensis]